MVATSLKVTLGAVARHPGADVGYQGVLTGGTVAARVEAGQGYADSTPTRGAPIPSLGLAAGRRDPCPIIDGHHGQPTMATPRARLSKKKFSQLRARLMGEAVMQRLGELAQ